MRLAVSFYSALLFVRIFYRSFSITLGYFEGRPSVIA